MWPWLWGSWFDNIFFLVQLLKFTLIPISKAEELVPACLSPFNTHLFHIFCLSPTYSSFFFLSPTLSSFSVCLHLFLNFLSVSISIETVKKWGLGWRLTDNKDKDGDRQRMRIRIETDKKWGTLRLKALHCIAVLDGSLLRDWLWNALGSRVLRLRVEDVTLGMRVLVW